MKNLCATVALDILNIKQNINNNDPMMVKKVSENRARPQSGQDIFLEVKPYSFRNSPLLKLNLKQNNSHFPTNIEL